MEMKSNVDWGGLLLAIASLHVDENEVHDGSVGIWDVSVALYHSRIKELVYVPRLTCPPGHCWKLHRAMHC